MVSTLVLSFIPNPKPGVQEVVVNTKWKFREVSKKTQRNAGKIVTPQYLLYVGSNIPTRVGIFFS